MIRIANEKDVNIVNGIFESVMTYEDTHEKYSVFQHGVYPTESMLADSIRDGKVFILENDGEQCACAVCDYNEPQEYAALPWTPGKALVVHLLAVAPVHYGKGCGSALMQYIFAYAREEGCVSVKLDTGEQNKPAQRLYEKKLGFRVVANTPMNVGGLIEHKEHFFYEHLV